MKMMHEQEAVIPSIMQHQGTEASLQKPVTYSKHSHQLSCMHHLDAAATSGLAVKAVKVT